MATSSPKLAKAQRNTSRASRSRIEAEYRPDASHSGLSESCGLREWGKWDIVENANDAISGAAEHAARIGLHRLLLNCGEGNIGARCKSATLSGEFADRSRALEMMAQGGVGHQSRRNELARTRLRIHIPACTR